MNKKAIIFTVDALVAFSIFIAVTIAIYSLLTPKPEINIQNSAIYMNSENFLRASDKAEILSQAFEQIQLGNTSNATAIIQNMLSGLPYPAEMRLNVYDGGNLVSSLTVNEQDFKTSIIVRKFLVLTLTENVGNYGLPFINVTVNSSEPKMLPFQVIMTSDQDAHSGVVVMPDVRYDLVSVQWDVIPDMQVIEFPGPGVTLPPLNFNVVIPPNAKIGEYQMFITAMGGGYNHAGYGHFNVIRYGIAELEVETS